MHGGQAEQGRNALGALLAERARRQPQRLAYQFLPDACDPAAGGALPGLDYAGLHRRAQAVVRALRGVARGGGAAPPRVLIGCPPGLDFVVALFGCLQAGAVAVPMPAPQRRDDPARWPRVVADAAPAAILTVGALVPALRKLLVARDAPALVEVDALGEADGEPLAAAAPQAPALLQYTSGSTRTPRGVVVSHANLAHNLGCIERLFGHDEHSRGLVWLPPYHDMGLVGGLLQPLYAGFPVTLMSPQSFLQRPLRWLQAIAALRISSSGGPDFAYAHAARRAAQAAEADLRGLDLSCWRVAFVGAEPVRAATLARFAEAFGRCGFDAAAFLPCYGLAESTLLVAGAHGRPRTLRLQRDALAQRRVQPLAAQAQGGLTLVGCGAAVGAEVVVVDGAQRPVAAGEVGELWLHGPSVGTGYWGDRSDGGDGGGGGDGPDGGGAVFGARLPGDARRFLRSGDLGFVHDGALYLTGRLRDLIILRGRNVAPQDLEHCAAGAHPALAAGGCAAFTVERDGHEDGAALVLAAELDRAQRHRLDADAVFAALRAALQREHGVQAAAIVLVRPQSLPRTPSGKLRRHRCAHDWQHGTLAEVARWNLPALRPGADAEPLLQWLRDYAEQHLDARLMDERRSLSPALVLDFGNRGLLGLQVPARWGGPGLSHAGFLRVVEQLAAIDATLGLFVGLNNVLGLRPLLRYGSDAQRERWLPQLAAGRVLAAFALTEPGAGSNPNALRASALPHGGGWLLQGRKWWSGSAAWAGLTHVFVREHDAGGRALGISAFALPRGRAGLRQGAEALTFGMRAMVQNAVHLDGVPVSDDDRLGAPGQGLAIAQDAMGYGRLTIAAACVGGMQRCAQLMLRYASRRQVAGGRLLEQPALRARLEEITCGITLLRALVGRLAATLDGGADVADEALAACKVLAPELYWQAVDALMQALGGRGYMEPSGVPQMLRDARVLRIFEGPTEALAAHLGACLRRRPQPLLELARGTPAAAALQGLADAAAARPTRAVEFGAAAAWGLAWSALDAGDAATQRWARQRFDAARAHALRDGEPAAADALAQRVAGYAAAIGDLEIGGIGEERTLDPLLRREEPAAPIVPAASAAPAAAAPAGAAASAPAAAAIETWLADWLAARLGIAAQRIDRDAAIAELGVDSLLAVELVEALEQAFAPRRPLDATLAWSHPSLRALAAHVAGEAVPAPAADALSDAELAAALADELAAGR